jgi:hypothetical protein
VFCGRCLGTGPFDEPGDSTKERGNATQRGAEKSLLARVFGGAAGAGGGLAGTADFAAGEARDRGATDLRGRRRPSAKSDP